jgi:hypothetical protein
VEYLVLMLNEKFPERLLSNKLSPDFLRPQCEKLARPTEWKLECSNRVPKREAEDGREREIRERRSQVLLLDPQEVSSRKLA